MANPEQCERYTAYRNLIDEAIRKNKYEPFKANLSKNKAVQCNQLGKPVESLIEMFNFKHADLWEFHPNFKNGVESMFTPVENSLYKMVWVDDEDDIDGPQIIPSQSGGAKKHKYNGRLYKVRTGTRGGKYIVVGKDKKKVYV